MGIQKVTLKANTNIFSHFLIKLNIENFFSTHGFDTHETLLLMNRHFYLTQTVNKYPLCLKSKLHLTKFIVKFLKHAEVVTLPTDRFISDQHIEN